MNWRLRVKGGVSERTANSTKVMQDELLEESNKREKRSRGQRRASRGGRGGSTAHQHHKSLARIVLVLLHNVLGDVQILLVRRSERVGGSVSLFVLLLALALVRGLLCEGRCEADLELEHKTVSASHPQLQNQRASFERSGVLRLDLWSQAGKGLCSHERRSR
ncbi:hypothetical protein RTBOTA2_000514 [Rhodotorula toruloides]|nr:hypothetical protein RTBOTA2_000514 [Rhodotorula toruloides]